MRDPRRDVYTHIGVFTRARHPIYPALRRWPPSWNADSHGTCPMVECGNYKTSTFGQWNRATFALAAKVTIRHHNPVASPRVTLIAAFYMKFYTIVGKDLAWKQQ